MAKRAKWLKTETAAARVFRTFERHAGHPMTLEQVAARSRLTKAQVRRAERYLKTWFNDHADQVPEWTLHIQVGKSRHGLIQDADASFRDAIARGLYMAKRAESELDYREQQIKRVADPITRKRLTRARQYIKTARDAYQDALDRMDGATR